MVAVADEDQASGQAAEAEGRPSGPVTDEDLREQGEVAADFMVELLSLMGIEADIEPRREAATMYVDVLGAGPEADDDMALLIGSRGATLDAIQEIVRAVVLNRTGMRARVVVDIEDYRKRQRERLEDEAMNIAERVRQTGVAEELEPMNSYDRKVVHDAVAAMEGVESESHGEGAERRVEIRPSS